MTPEDPRRQLRIAAHAADGRAIVAALLRQVWDDMLQHAGDALLIALTQRAEGSEALAERCAEGLRERDWDGDAELADQLEAALGRRPLPLLRPLPVDLEDLSDILEGDPVHGGGRIDLRTGEVWPESAIEYSRELGEEEEEEEDDDGDEDDDGERWLDVWCEGSRDGYRDMEEFIATLADPDLAGRLSDALTGRGAFRRFRDVLERSREGLDRWHTYADERRRGRARAWLAGEGIAARRPSIPERPESP